jgi:hypothetical protein
MAEKCMKSIVRKNLNTKQNYLNFISDEQKKGDLKECTNDMYDDVFKLVNGYLPSTQPVEKPSADNCIKAMDKNKVPPFVRKNFKNKQIYLTFISDEQKSGNLKECTNDMYDDVLKLVNGSAPSTQITQQNEYNIPTADKMKQLLNNNNTSNNLREEILRSSRTNKILRGGKIQKYLFKLQQEEITSNKFKLYLDKLNYYYNL